MCSTSGVQKMVQGPLELQLIVSCHVGSRNQTCFLYEQPVLSATELFLQPQFLIFKRLLTMSFQV